MGLMIKRKVVQFKKKLPQGDLWFKAKNPQKTEKTPTSYNL